MMIGYDQSGGRDQWNANVPDHQGMKDRQHFGDHDTKGDLAQEEFAKRLIKLYGQQLQTAIAKQFESSITRIVEQTAENTAKKVAELLLPELLSQTEVGRRQKSDTASGDCPDGWMWFDRICKITGKDDRTIANWGDKEAWEKGTRTLPRHVKGGFRIKGSAQRQFTEIRRFPGSRKMAARIETLPERERLAVCELLRNEALTKARRCEQESL
jgi:hypothetical protein